MKKQSNNTIHEPIYSVIHKLDAAYKLERLCAFIASNSQVKKGPIKLIEFSLGGHVSGIFPILDEELKKENLYVIGSHFSSFIKHSDFNKSDWDKIINGTFLSREFNFRNENDIEVVTKCFFELVPEDKISSFVPKVIFSLFPIKNKK